MKQLHRRVVVTGLGILSPIGNTVKMLGNPVLKVKGITIDIGLEDNPVKIGGGKNFEPEFLDSKRIRRIDPFIQYGIFAAINFRFWNS